MNIDKNLILIKGQDRTKDIRRWEYLNGRIVVTFNDGASFPYAHYNVEFLKNPIEINIKDCLVLKNKQPLSNVVRVQNFNDYIRLFYKNAYTETVRSSEIQFVNSCLTNPNSKNVFEYLKQIAYAVSLHSEDGSNILGNRYKKIDFVREDCILASYLNGSTPAISNDSPKTAVYPFGFNKSQKTAVDNALNNNLSIIEGPPGTGKTQTILNIIANAVMRGESVAVVSSNNSAIANVMKKMQKYDLGFITAFLGSSTNKETFIDNQTEAMPAFESWILSNNDFNQIKNTLLSMGAELDNMLKNKIALSRITQELESILLEYPHFLEYYNETNEKDINFRTFKRLSGTQLLKLWIQSEQNVSEGKQLATWDKLKNFFKFGIYNRSFYQNSLERIVAICQKSYYEATQRELETKKAEIESKLISYSFESKMAEYSDLSMRLFKSMVGNKYKPAKQRQIYEMDDLWKNSNNFLLDYPVILSTTYSLRSSLSSRVVYDYVIVDEGSQVDLATGALALSCAKKAVIVGDLKQLPNVVKDDMKQKTDNIFRSFSIPEAYRFSNHSLLSSVAELFNNAPRVMLKEHYRCHPQIIEFCNKKFYDDQLITLSAPKTDRQPLIVYKTVEGNHARERINQRQIDVITEEVIPKQKLNVNDGSIGIVSPYRNHTDALQKAFENTTVQADTIDKFQGQEKDTIILCTVDNEVSDFADCPNRLNVAVSRAVNQLIVVTDGNNSDKDSNIKDLINYIKYNNLEVVQSEIYSVFDYLYKSYSNQRDELLKNQKKVSDYDSENLMYGLIREVLKQEKLSKLDVVLHVPLKMIIRDLHNLNDEEALYAMNILTHVDFLIYDKLSKQPVLVAEVDGYAFHKQNSKQFKRDNLKDAILNKYNIPFIRFKTNESNERKRLTEKLLSILT